ncbi:hypothetical protein [Microbacterium sp. PMB16]|uniref:hypothetical protein n=1 Tax=Microbacterium sp. PMB16 TaxID=3120157 RepID=UPI003F4C6D41
MPQTTLNPLRVERGNLRLSRHSSVLGVIANSLAVVAPIVSIALGVWVTNLNSDVAHLNATINGLHQDVASSEALLTDREEIIESLRAENRELLAALPPSIPPEQVPDARNIGTVTLAAGGDSIDLNSTLANFGNGADRIQKDTLQFGNGVLTSLWGIDVLQLPEGEASYESCAVATGYAPAKSIEPHRLDGRVCIRLKSGNYARITVDKLEDERVELTLTTWDAPL